MADQFAKLPDGACYAVIFSAQRTESDNGYDDMAERMGALAATMPGYIGIESARDADGFGVTVSYWKSEEAIRGWKRQVEHMEAQRLGRQKWYTDYRIRVARVERAYGMTRKGGRTE